MFIRDQFAFLTAAILIGLIGSEPSTLHAQGTAFTYQGRLNDSSSPANGRYDFRFKLYNDPYGNFQAGSSYLTNAIATTNGLFTTTLDFGAGVYNGATNWLEIDVRTNGNGAYTVLNPLQALTPTPSAIYAETASNLSGTISATQISGPVASANLSGIYSSALSLSNPSNTISGTFTGSGRGLTNVWQLGGNNVAAGQFLGSTNNAPLEFWVNGQRALRLEPTDFGSPNVISGGTNNFVTPDVVAGVIAGGSWNTIQGPASFSSVGGGSENSIQGNAVDTWKGYNIAGVIGGGNQNLIQTNVMWGVIGGGGYNSIQIYADESFIGGGYNNNIQGNSNNWAGNFITGDVIVGGSYNTVGTNATGSFIGGGYYNQNNGNYAVIGGGYNNIIQTGSYYSTIAGGVGNYIDKNVSSAFAAGSEAQAMHTGAFVWADSQGATFASTTTNEFNVRAQNGLRIQSNKGIHLEAGDEPIIVRDWDVFATNAPASKVGIGRWGLFMEPTILTLGIPAEDVSPRYFQIAKYNTNGTPTALMQVDQSGNANLTGSVAALSVIANTNLQIASGSFQVLGAGINTATAAFTQLSAAANISGDRTTINNYLCNNDPNAILIVTHNYNPGGTGSLVVYNHVVGTFYTGGKWSIYNEDQSTMATNVAFNVLVIKH